MPEPMTLPQLLARIGVLQANYAAQDNTQAAHTARVLQTLLCEARGQSLPPPPPPGALPAPSIQQLRRRFLGSEGEG